MKKRTKVLLGIGSGMLVLGGAAVVFGPDLYATYAASVALEQPALDPTARDLRTNVDVDNLTGTWTVSDGSEAGYRVNEVLQGRNVTVTGRTSEVTGSFTVADFTLTAATVSVDVASISTSEPPRDAYFRDVAMEVGEFPTATFVLTEPVSAQRPEPGSRQSFTATGELTVHGRTAVVTAKLDAALTETGGQVSGSIPITFGDFGVEAPSLGFVRVEDSGFVEFVLNVTQD